MHISVAVEGAIDEAIAGVLIRTVGGTVGPVYGKKGKPPLMAKLSGYNSAAKATGHPWFVLIDLDHDEDCAPPLRHRLLPVAASSLCFRIAVREAESWLLADRDRLASYFRIPKTAVPANPEALPDPKRTLVDLCRKSRSTGIRGAMVPRPRSGRIVGPGYTNVVSDFIRDPDAGWRCETAALQADSLRRAMVCLRRLVGTG